MLGSRPARNAVNPNHPIGNAAELPGAARILYTSERTTALLIRGAPDRIVPVSAGREYQRRIPGSRLEVIENCGHHPELGATEQFVALVEGFLR